jgi:hypothetical protein
MTVILEWLSVEINHRGVVLNIKLDGAFLVNIAGVAHRYI